LVHLLQFLSGFALGAVCLLIVIVARDFGYLKVGKVFVALMVSGAFFLIQDLVPAPWNDISSSISTMVPALFWLLCQLAFSYRPKVVSITGFLALYTFVAPAIGKFTGIAYSENETLHFFSWTLGTYFEYLVIGLGLWTVVSHWEDDLVESSRKLRKALLISVGIAVLLVVVPMNTGLFNLGISYIAIGSAVIICSYFLIEGKKGVLFGTVEDLKVEKTLVIEEQVNNIIEDQYQLKLNALMLKGFYRTEHLTIKTLALKLELPEYKTRALINQTLGYRNFNDYINQLRINEAAQRLTNEPDTPILNISLDVGYRTLSSFNRAFKELKNTTPTDHRLSKP
jgi:AraC-like DNA-binding protein